MNIEEIIRRLEKIAEHAVHTPGEKPFGLSLDDGIALHEAVDLLRIRIEQDKIKKQFIEAFNTIRDAYNIPASREKILLNYLLRNACCCEKTTESKKDMKAVKQK